MRKTRWSGSALRVLRYTPHALNDDTARALNAINRRFYEERASEFNQSRERPWKGWSDLFERIDPMLPPSPRVLDLGCGNGRFARFLRERRDEPLRYCGVDQSSLGLTHARARLAGVSGVRFEHHDFLDPDAVVPESLAAERFDLVVLFGVLHHVPGHDRRLAVLRAACDKLAPGGTIAYTVWRFERFERFRRKLVPWRSYRAAAPDPPIDESDLEDGDHLMTWGGAPPALRYCHAMSDEEASVLAESLPAREVERFLGDDELNTYFVLSGAC